jgi:hypothetical protein
LQRRGQLMGTFLSFPLLCLVNYLTFKFLVPRDVPVRVNGDDIVFRATPEEVEVWSRGVGAAGLVLSTGKTLVDPEFFVLNSTMFKGSPQRVRLVPFVRARALMTRPDTPAALCGQFAALCPGLNGAARRLWQIRFLSMGWNRRMIALSQRSLTRGLGLRVPLTVLRQTGFLHRERYYLGLKAEVPLPAKRDPGVAFTPAAPGFRSSTRTEALLGHKQWRRVRQASEAYGLACRLYAQLPPSLPQKANWVEGLKRGTERYWRPKRVVWDLYHRMRARKSPELHWTPCPIGGWCHYAGVEHQHRVPCPSWSPEVSPWPIIVGPGRREERLVYPVAEGGEGERAGLGWARRPRIEDWVP